MKAKVMTKKQQNNHPGTGCLTEIRTMISGFYSIEGATAATKTLLEQKQRPTYCNIRNIRLYGRGSI